MSDSRAGAAACDVVVVGAGFAGMYMLHRLRELELSTQVLEAGSDVGGTWYWNRYPGARCDVPSLDYSYSFSDELQQEWEWTERYAAQPEIERYAHHVADRFDLRRDIRFDTRVRAVRYDASASHWTVETDGGERIVARYVIMATGGYSRPIKPDIVGLDVFAGEIYSTTTWPQREVTFAGKRVGIIGTGSSGMQTATAIGQAGDVGHLYVFQRTPNYVIPAQNQPLGPQDQAAFKRRYAEYREQARHSGFGIPFKAGSRSALDYSDEEFQQVLDEAWAVGGSAVLSLFPDVLVNEQSNNRLTEYVRQRLRARVEDPEVAEALCAKTHFIGSRRLLVETGYPEIFDRDNVTLVSVADNAITEITPDSLRLADGAEYELDMLILATGFDSGTGAMLGIDIEGRDGATMRQHWSSGPRTYLGLMAHGFPNMFTIAGAGSPSIRSQVIVSIEQHVEWITDLLRHAEGAGVVTIEPTAEAEDDWTRHVADVAASTLTMRDDTQYVGVNVPGKPRVYVAYLGGVGVYRQICDAVRDRDYEGFVLMTSAGVLPAGTRWSGPGERPVERRAL